MVACIYCGATEKQKKKGFDANKRQFYYCIFCNRKYTEYSIPRPKREKRTVKVINCINCGKETTNPKFCSQSCAATYTNKLTPKRKRVQRYCKYCRTPLTGYKTVCDDCNPSVVDWSNRSLQNMRQRLPYQAYAVIRRLARNVYRTSNRVKCCERCGYDKYYEVCHLHAISDFSDDTPVTVINALDNLLALCPNCHWELDHGRLRYEDGVFVEVTA